MIAGDYLCLQKSSKSYEQNLVVRKSSGKVDHGTGNRQIQFGDVPDYHQNIGTWIERIL